MTLRDIESKTLKVLLLSLRPITTTSGWCLGALDFTILADLGISPVNKVYCVVVSVKRKTVTKSRREVERLSEEIKEICIHVEHCLVRWNCHDESYTARARKVLEIDLYVVVQAHKGLVFPVLPSCDGICVINYTYLATGSW
jgi:hypothetical protein